jgi:hypothetical protein
VIADHFGRPTREVRRAERPVVGTDTLVEIGDVDFTFTNSELTGLGTDDVACWFIDGQPSRPFSMRTPPPNPSDFDDERAEIVRRATRHRYDSPVELVELNLSRNAGPRPPAVAIT